MNSYANSEPQSPSGDAQRFRGNSVVIKATFHSSWQRLGTEPLHRGVLWRRHASASLPRQPPHTESKSRMVSKMPTVWPWECSVATAKVQFAEGKHEFWIKRQEPGEWSMLVHGTAYTCKLPCTEPFYKLDHWALGTVGYTHCSLVTPTLIPTSHQQTLKPLYVHSGSFNSNSFPFLCTRKPPGLTFNVQIINPFAASTLFQHKFGVLLT